MASRGNPVELERWYFRLLIVSIFVHISAVSMSIHELNTCYLAAVLICRYRIVLYGQCTNNAAVVKMSGDGALERRQS